MKQLTNILGIIILFLSIYGCSETKYGPDHPYGYLDYMPEETSVGANTFGCYVNGDLAAAQDAFQREGTGLGGYVNGYWKKVPSFWTDSILNYMGMTLDSKHYNIYIRIDDVPVLGTNDCTFWVVFKTLDGRPEKYKETTVNITTFDTIKQIISGRFDDIYFESVKVHFTKGQFDINYGKNF